MRHRAVLLASLVALLGLALAACGGSGSSDQPAAPPPQTLTVSAAASLTEVYQGLAQQFQAANPGATVKFNFGGSDQLAQQVVQGAPADVLATASSKTMQTAVAAGKIQGEPIVYATNKLQIAVAPNNPKQITSLQALAAPGVTSVVCAPRGALRCRRDRRREGRGRGPEAGQRGAGRQGRADPGRDRQRRRAASCTSPTSRAPGARSHGVDFPQATAKGVKHPTRSPRGHRQQERPARAVPWVSFVAGPQGKAAAPAAGFSTK